MRLSFIFFLTFLLYPLVNCQKTVEKPNQKLFAQKVHELFLPIYSEEKLYKILDAVAPLLPDYETEQTKIYKALFTILTKLTGMDELGPAAEAYTEANECMGPGGMEKIFATIKPADIFSPMFGALVPSMMIGKMGTSKEDESSHDPLERVFGLANQYLTKDYVQLAVTHMSSLFTKRSWNCLTKHGKKVFAFDKYDCTHLQNKKDESEKIVKVAEKVEKSEL